MRQLWDDVKWAVRMFRARRFRACHCYSSRKRFDHALRPLIHPEQGVNSPIVGYPDAVYCSGPHDLARAIRAAKTRV